MPQSFHTASMGMDARNARSFSAEASAALGQAA